MAEWQIISAQEHIHEIRMLFEEYITEECVIKRGINLEFQHVESELEHLPGKYSEPEGGLFLLYWQGNPAGCAAFRKMDNESCELKRLYIRRQFRGLKLGGKLLSHLLKKAKEKGYLYAYCDTLSSMTEAVSAYRKMSFSETKPYYRNPLQEVLYFKKVL